MNRITVYSLKGNKHHDGIKGLTKSTFCTVFVEVVDLEADISVSPSAFPAEVDGLFLGRQANVGGRHCETFGPRNQTN